MKCTGNGSSQAQAVLQGSLEVFSLWDILQWLGQWSGEGVLELAAAPGAPLARIHCRDGSLVAIEGAGPGGESTTQDGLAPCPGRLGALLVEQGALDVPGLRAALGLQARLRVPEPARTPLGAIASQAGLIDGARLRPALRELAWRRLLACLGRGQGAFSVIQGPPLRPGLPVEEPIGPLLLRAAEACDAAGTAGGGPGFA